MSLVSYAAKLAIKPKGPVEEALFEHIWQQKPIDTVLGPLLDAEVFLFYQPGDGAERKPLVTQGKDAQPAMLVFTARSRAEAVAKQLPDPAAQPEAMAFREVLKWAPVELGLLINMGNALSAECGRSDMDGLRKKAGVFRP